MKEYNKLSESQFVDLIRSLEEIRHHQKDFREIIINTNKDRIKSLLGKDFCWGDLYEFRIEESLAFLILAMGLQEQVHQIAVATDPQQAALDWAKIPMSDWELPPNSIFEEKHIIGAFVALQRNIMSIMLYHRSVCDLVRQVRELDDWQEPFFLAVRVDSTVLTCPTFSDRIAYAELTDDKLFFIRLRSSLKGPSKKHWESYKDLRYAMCVLREMGFDRISDAQLEDLLVDKLKVYPRNPSARKNLRKQFNESKRVQLPKK